MSELNNEASALKLKYQSLVDYATQNGASDLLVREQDNVLYIDGSVPTEAIKKGTWDVYNQVDPDYRSGDLVLNLQVVASQDSVSEYVVQSGDSLSKIASKYGLTWQQIFEVNKETISNPDKIFPGQKITIPLK